MAKRRLITRSIIDVASGLVERVVSRLYDGDWSRVGGMPAFDQSAYGFFNDGTESGATQIGSSDTQQTLDIDTTYHVRLEVTETNGNDGLAMPGNWEYNRNGAGFVAITTTSSIVIAVDGGLVDGNDTTQRLGGGGTFVTPNAWQCEDGTQPNLTYVGSEISEGVLAFQIVGADVNHGDEILIQLAGLSTWTFNADIDVNKPAGAGPPLGTLALMGAGI